jgi:hypothetical protein
MLQRLNSNCLIPLPLLPRKRVYKSSLSQWERELKG